MGTRFDHERRLSMARRATIGPVTRVRRAPAWKQCDIAERLKDCLRMLHIHGYLSDGDFRKKFARVITDELDGKFAGKVTA